MFNEYIHALLNEFATQDKSGIYAWTQKYFSYNSNRIEGSTLTPRQTAAIFETGALSADGGIYRTKDIEEMTGHFTMFNYMLQTFNQPLTEELIKQYHFKLKAGVFEDIANGYPIGEYKNKANTVANIQTSLPRDVHGDMCSLLDEYQLVTDIDVGCLAWLHIRFENIHPFQDGNGRVGRIILFKECLKHGIIPFIVEDEKKYIYYDALYDEKKLTMFFEDEQREYAKTISGFTNVDIDPDNPDDDEPEQGRRR